MRKLACGLWACLGIAAAGLASGPALAQGTCFPSRTQLCLNGSRFRVEVDWALPGGVAGKGQAVPLAGDTGLFWFFDNANLELTVKVLDGRAVNGHFWVYYGALSDVEYRITVTDTATGAQELYVNPQGRLASAADVDAFGPEPAAATPAPSDTLPENAPSRLGPETRINVTTEGNQYAPAVAVGPDGTSMIIWLGAAGDVQGRFYDAAGRPRTGEVAIAPAARLPGLARVAADASGRFLVAWRESLPLDAPRVKARLYTADGQPATGEIAVGFNPGPQGLPAVVADPQGGFLLAWPEISDGTLRLQRFDSQGGLRGSEVVITRPGENPRLAADPVDGGFVMAWVEPSFPYETDVRALRLDAEAHPIGTAAAWVNYDLVRRPGFHQRPVPVAYPGGGFSVVWTTNGIYPGVIPGAVEGLFARRFGADGRPAGPVLQLSAGSHVEDGSHDALALPTGETMVLWYEEGRSQDRDGGLFARLYDEGWDPRTSPFRINTFTEELQVAPAAAVDPTGTVVTAWTSTVPDFVFIPPPGYYQRAQDGDHGGIFAQRFATAGCAGADELCLGGRFRVGVQYADPQTGETRTGHAAALTGDTVAFWFFQADNAELMVKVLDGRAVNGSFWVYYGALSDVDYTITVTDTRTGARKTYHNDRHRLASGADVDAFPAPAD